MSVQRDPKPSYEDVLAEMFVRRFSRQRRRAMTTQEAFIEGARLQSFAARRVLRPRLMRAYLVGLRRGYRAGSSG